MFQPGFRAGPAYDDHTLIGMIKNLGAQSSLNFAYDAADINSWPGSGQTFFDVSGNGIDLWRGNSSSSEGNNDCSFTGTAGNKSSGEYWVQPSITGAPTQGIFRFKTVPLSFAQSWHKDSAAFTIFAIIWIDAFSAGLQRQYIFYDSDGSGPGIQLFANVASSKKLSLVARKAGGTTVLTADSSGNIPSSAWAFVAITIDEAANDGALFVNGSRTDFSAEYSSPGTDDATDGVLFGGFMQFGRLGVAGAASRAWADTEVAQLYAKLKANRYTTLP